MVERGAQTQVYALLRERAVLGRQTFNKVMCSLNIYRKKCNVANTSYQNQKPVSVVDRHNLSEETVKLLDIESSQEHSGQTQSVTILEHTTDSNFSVRLGA